MVAVKVETEQNRSLSEYGGIKGPNSANGDGYRYEAFKVIPSNMQALQARVLPIYLTFRKNYFLAVDRVRERVSEGAIVRFAIPKRGSKAVGFISYHMRDIAVDDRRLSIADIATIVVVPEHQTHGIGTRLFKDIAEEDVPNAFTGVVQEPFTTVAKLRTGYCDMQGRRESDEYPLEVVRPLIRVLEFGNRTTQITDWRFGICAGYFPLDERARRLMIDGARHPEAHDIYEAWLKTGFRPENGDGKRYWLPTVQDRVNPREPTYRE